MRLLTFSTIAAAVTVGAVCASHTVLATKPPTMAPVPFVVIPIPGTPAVSVWPVAGFTGTTADWAFWGWRPTMKSTHVVTGSDG